jgi:hypothetical protein
MARGADRLICAGIRRGYAIVHSIVVFGEPFVEKPDDFRNQSCKLFRVLLCRRLFTEFSPAS